MPRRTKFPSPGRCTIEDRAVLCPADRVLALYNEANGNDTRERICEAVREWFIKRALAKGWAGVRFVKDVQSSHGAGCILWIKAPVEVVVNEAVLILLTES